MKGLVLPIWFSLACSRFNSYNIWSKKIWYFVITEYKTAKVEAYLHKDIKDLTNFNVGN